MCVEPVRIKHVMLVRGFLGTLSSMRIMHYASCSSSAIPSSLATCLNAGVENRCGWTRIEESEKSLAGLQSHEIFAAIGS